MARKSLKLVGLLTVMGALILGLSGLAFADAPAPAAKAYKSGKGINYPAYLYPRGQRWEATYKKYVKPAKGYDFTLYPLASYKHVSDWE